MKKLFVGIMSVLAFTVGAVETHDWKITEVTENKAIVGYIYHTGAVGTQIGVKTERFVTGLRFVCSTKAALTPADPLITIYWNTMIGSIPQYTEIQLDKKPPEVDLSTFRWEQDGPLLYRSVYISKSLIKLMKTSNSISFSWLGTDAVRRTTMFDLKTFNAHLGEFSALCKIEL